MDKDHLIELISSNLLYESKDSESTENLCDFKNYLKKLNLDQLNLRVIFYLLQKIILNLKIEIYLYHFKKIVYFLIITLKKIF